jgi:hypothetical protein
MWRQFRDVVGIVNQAVSSSMMPVMGDIALTATAAVGSLWASCS